MTPRNPDDETRYLGPTGSSSGSSAGQERPRQYFPGEHDPDYHYEPPAPQYPQYEAPAPSAPAPQRGGTSMLLGILFGLAILAAVAFFFLWRSAAGNLAEERATVPTTPPPVTVTSVVTQTQTSTVTETSRVLPTAIPSQLPDIGGWIDSLTGGQAEPTPAQ
ncbi:hypothetical protein CATRI_01750 [Corynebacterium atrinae]|uniref:hypothetical protein n=1 Tax=Corynebacterium atrinae TaxID=1336740 RepID=UPI0025B5DD55|nr:hypothetical protein [Corynebacterium atrinae]WJY62459.1 hypothetical protein CATRI_01750 [Corynebacterium atrinae]